jgi:hypothetical protein
MENIKNASSEEELLQLRNEGKISEVEYNDLLGAMKSWPAKPEDALPGAEKSRSKRKLGKIAFYLMLAGIIVPMICLGVCIWSNYRPWRINEKLIHADLDFATPACFALWAVIEGIAFVLGVIAWPDAFGKATVALITFILVLLLLLLIMSAHL